MRCTRSRLTWCLITLALAAAPIASQETRTVVILVRHAERAAEPANDPGLTAEGEARAADLADRLADAGLSAIYSTPYSRTRRTAEAVAGRTGLPVRVVPIAGNVDDHARDIADRILRENAGHTVLVVGHSNTIPVIARALGSPDPGSIADDEYDDLFIVIIGPRDTRQLIRARYGPSRTWPLLN
ncbi:MAG: histidine phosphatase family protein [Gemmatimonadetes bacterium]|nr:histidine phosphatase family protein [Gemmatimonadota bacterium]